MTARQYGWRPDVPDVRDFKLSVAPGDAGYLPPVLSLRDGMPPVWDQGNLGSCTGQSIAALVQYGQRKVHPEWDFKPSSLFIYYNERWVEKTIDVDCGAQIRTGIKVVAKIGACRDDLWPYNITRFTERPSTSAYVNALSHRAVVYQRVPQTLNGIKKVIGMGCPFVFGMSVYGSFESDEVAKTGVVPLPSVRDKMLGGHAVVGVGLDDSDQTILVRNSWGENWGIGGYFKLPYDYILNDDLVCDLWYISRMQ